MPELPEVEIVRRALVPFLTGRTPLRFSTSGQTLRRMAPAGSFTRLLAGRRVVGVRRRAKYLLIDVEDARALMVHLGMTGRLVVVDAGAPADRHDHLRIHLDDGRELRYNDARRFGQLSVHRLDAPGAWPAELSALGPEPLARSFDGACLWRALQGRRTPIKPLLLDQTVVAGVGNIYASEALFRARVRPDRPAASLDRAEAASLARAIKAVLRASIRQGGTTLRDYRAPNGEEGRFLRRLQVYDRAGEPCPVCGRPLLLSRQAGRSTYHCDGCQS